MMVRVVGAIVVLNLFVLFLGWRRAVLKERAAQREDAAKSPAETLVDAARGIRR